MERHEMILPELQNLAQIAIARIVNSLPEGILIAVITWMTLRLLPSQNSRTRFAVWFVALLTVASLPFIVASGRADSFMSQEGSHSLFTVPDQWAFILFSVWIIAMCGAVTHLALGMFRLGALRRSCKVVKPADLHPALAKVLQDFSASHPVTLAASNRLTVPSAVGFFKPMIVVPAWVLRELTPEEFRIILLHEFAHLHRRDDWTNLLQKVLRALFIFHPAVWWIERQLSLEREMACDDHVLAETGNPRGYAKCLVALLERSFARRVLLMAQAAVHRADEARQRLARILDSNRSDGKRFGKAVVGVAGVLSLLCLGAVPHAPEIVAFAPSASELQAASAPMFANSEFATASVIPAAMHTRTVQPQKTFPIAHRESSMNAPVIAAKANVAAKAPRVVKAKATRRGMPVETVLVIRTTEQIGPGAWISRVTVWRLTWVPSGTQRVPAAKTT
jgi:beta-lactamase regulating signal transducer with metallopeptidase domain